MGMWTPPEEQGIDRMYGKPLSGHISLYRLRSSPASCNRYVYTPYSYKN
jgi:hypothetical protein